METQSRIKHGEDRNNADTETTSAVKETAQVTWWHSMQSAHFRSVRQALIVPLTFVKRGCWQAVIGVMGLQHYLCPQRVALPLSVFLNVLSNRTPPTVYASK